MTNVKLTLLKTTQSQMRIHSHTQINTTIHLNSNVNYKFGGIFLLSKIQNLQSSHISSGLSVSSDLHILHIIFHIPT